MRNVKAGVMVVTMHDGSTQIVEADKKRIEDGTLTLLAMENISGYRCPLKLHEVATFAPGIWKSVRQSFEPEQSTLKEPDAPISD